MGSTRPRGCRCRRPDVLVREREPAETEQQGDEQQDCGQDDGRLDGGRGAALPVHGAVTRSVAAVAVCEIARGHSTTTALPVTVAVVCLGPRSTTTLTLVSAPLPATSAPATRS